jgi:hypothetical protein
LVICCRPGTEDVGVENFLAVVETFDETLNMIIVKMTMQKGEELTTR